MLKSADGASISTPNKLRKLPIWPPFSSFPTDVLKWMKKNANPQMSLKLMQVCRYFQHNNFPYFVVKCLHGSNDGWRYEALQWPLTDFRYRNIDVDNCEKSFWITSSLHLFGNSNLILNLLPKIAVCDIKNLYLSGENIVTFEQFKLLTISGSITTITLHDTILKDENDEAVPLEDIFECLPNAYLFEIHLNSNSIVSYQQATKKVSSKLRSIYHITETYEIKETLKFIQANPHITFTLYIDNERTVVFTQTLQSLTNNLLQNILHLISYFLDNLMILKKKC